MTSIYDDRESFLFRAIVKRMPEFGQGVDVKKHSPKLYTVHIVGDARRAVERGKRGAPLESTNWHVGYPIF